MRKECINIPGNYQYNALNNGFFVQRNWHKNKLDLLEYLGIQTFGNSLVDIGCGSGNMLFRYAAYFDYLVGLDNNQEALDFVTTTTSARQFPNVSAHFFDLLSFDNVLQTKFDCALCMEVFEHFTLDDLKSLVIPNIRNLLNPGGYLIVTTPNYASYYPLLEKILDLLSLVPPLAGEQHLSGFNKDTLCTILTKHGFSLQKVGSFNHFSPYLPVDSLRAYTFQKEVTFVKSFGPLLYLVAVLEEC